jgi:hypothetical protein
MVISGRYGTFTLPQNGVADVVLSLDGKTAYAAI